MVGMPAFPYFASCFIRLLKMGIALGKESTVYFLRLGHVNS